MEKQRLCVLIVEDNESSAEYFKKVISTSAYPVFHPVWVSSLAATAKAIQKQTPDVVLIDLNLFFSWGEQTIDALIEASSNGIPIIVLTDADDENVARESLKTGAQDYLKKNACGQDKLVNKILSSIERIKYSDRKIAETSSQLNEANIALLASQQQLVQSEKMASIGQLAAGVAHDINNPVGFVMSNLGSLTGYVEILASLLNQYGTLAASVEPELDEASSKLLKNINTIKEEEDLEYILEDAQQLLAESLDGVNRIKDIVISLKGFARSGNDPVEDVDINAGIESTLKVVGNELKYNCQVHEEYGDLPGLCCIPGQLNQIFMNLLVNAGHAIEENGEIHIKTWADDENINVRISDTGKGISEENLKNIFDAFFTTKPVGKGTGLGLSVSYGIVQKHGGSIEVTSEVGKGTQFTVILPKLGIPCEANGILNEKIIESWPDGEKEHEHSIQ